MATPLAAAFAFVLLLAGGPCAHGARSLRQARPRGWDADGDPSGVSGYNAARVFNPGPAGPTSRSALTPEAAEASSNPGFGGVNRVTAPPSRRTYATVEASTTVNEARKDVAVLPRQRSAHDLPAGGVALASGNANMPALVMGGVAYSQTYEGAQAIASTDSIAMRKAGKNEPVAANHVTSKPGVWRVGVSKRKVVPGSFGVTGSPVGSLAMSGAANARAAVAQAETAVAMSQTERLSKWDN